MAVFRVHKDKNYTTMSNYHLKDKNLSYKGKGLLSMMLSLPNSWDYSINGLVAISKENERAVKSTLGELKKLGYLNVVKERTPKGTFDYSYDIYEKPGVHNPPVVRPPVDVPPVESAGQLNTNESNTNESNTNDDKESKKVRKITFDELINNYTSDVEIRDLLGEWLKVRKAKHSAMTNRAIELNLKKIDKLAIESKLSVKEYLEEVIARGWAAFYVINNYNQRKVSNNNREENLPSWFNKSNEELKKEQEPVTPEELAEFEALKMELKEKYGEK